MIVLKIKTNSFISSTCFFGMSFLHYFYVSKYIFEFTKQNSEFDVILLYCNLNACFGSKADPLEQPYNAAFTGLSGATLC